MSVEFEKKIDELSPELVVLLTNQVSKGLVSQSEVFGKEESAAHIEEVIIQSDKTRQLSEIPQNLGQNELGQDGAEKLRGALKQLLTHEVSREIVVREIRELPEPSVYQSTTVIALTLLALAVISKIKYTKDDGLSIEPGLPDVDKVVSAAKWLLGP